jgi:CheY-like chemotaxis protein
MLPASLRILLVDDDLEDRELFEMALQELRLNADVRTARDGVDALEQLSSPVSAVPDIIFLDLNMPRMDGRQLLVRLRSQDRYRQVPVVVYSTSTASTERQSVQRLGATDYLVKPNSFGTLCKGLKDVIRLQLGTAAGS